MILKSLAEYYERLLSDPDSDVAPPGFEKKAIPFLLVIDDEGDLFSIKDTRTGEGKKKTAKDFLLPAGEKKSSGVKANLLWDNPQYVLGFPKSDKEKDVKRASEFHKAFLDKIREEFGDDFQDKGLMAVTSFLSKGRFEKIFSHELWPEIEENNANLTFMLKDDDKLVAQSPDIISRIIDSQKVVDNAQVCSVSGERDKASELHTAIKGVWGAQTAGANIVSFNLDAFRSFGKKQGMNAPVGQKTMFAYTTALNTLLAKGSQQRMQIGDASTVFWATETHPFEDDFSCFLAEPPKGEKHDYGKIRSLLNAVKTGILPSDDDTGFYVLGLAPNAARISIRFWYEGNVRDMKHKIAQHFEDIEMIRAPHDREFLSLFQLLVATATEGKADNITPNLGGEVARAVMIGTGYPRTLLTAAIRRCKAEQRVTLARAAVIKGYLTREARIHESNKKEVRMSLDKEYTNNGYVLGRLFALLERIQEKAHTTKLNKTIRDTYFSAATSNPLVTFKRLQDLSIHHLSKIKNSGANTTWLEMQMQEIVSKIPSEGIPATLSLDDQGRFAIGYYHQRQDFFQQKPDENKGE